MRDLPDISKFGLINIAGNFAAVFADQSFHQRGIASSPKVASRGFILGGIAWFAVPMVMASSMGLAARALYGKDPAMALLTDMEVSEGLAAPAAAAALMGKSGAAAMLILLYLAVTSATSAQLIAVSSILTFDIYKVYIKPSASSRETYWVSHLGVATWSIVLGLLGLIFNYTGLSMGWLYTFMGIIICPAVFPVFACLSWRKANGTGALVAMIAGLFLGVMTWLVTAYKQSGSLTVVTTGMDDPLLAGNLVSLLVPVVILGVWSLLKPANYNFEGTRAINAPGMIVDKEYQATVTERTGSDSGAEDLDSPDKTAPVASDSEKAAGDSTSSSLPAQPAIEADDEHHHVRQAGLDPAELQASVRMAVKVAIPLATILIIVVPCMAIIPKHFTVTGLGAWIGIIMAWLFCAAGIVIFLPVWESREELGNIFRGMWADVTGKRGREASRVAG